MELRRRGRNVAISGRRAGAEEQIWWVLVSLFILRLVFLLFNGIKTYQTEVDFHRGGDENRPAEPGCIVADDHALPDVDSANGAGDVDDDSKTEDRDNGKTLAGGQLETPDQRHWQGCD